VLRGNGKKVLTLWIFFVKKSGRVCGSDLKIELLTGL